MNGTSSLASIATRIAALSQAPAAVSEIRGRFAAMVESATAAAATAGTASGTATTTGAADAVSSTARAQTLAVPPTGLTGPAAGPTATSATASATGPWAARVPNERGQALVPAIAATAQRYGLDPAFLAAVFWTESSYTPDAVSPTGAIGLGQLMPQTAQWLGVDPWDPMQNMEGSARLYRYYLDKYNGDVELSISAYAAGPGAVAQAGGIPDDFTADYITKLLGRRDYLNGLRPDAP
jgi:soluble lytic murein transglycosylase-like protein